MDKSSKKKNTRKTGDIGEQIAQKYLTERGFTVLETNYLRKWGELDIVAKKRGNVHFVEVKTYKYDSKEKLHSSLGVDNWRPEELVDERKLHQISKALETWLSERKWVGEWQIDVIAVRMVPEEKYATVKWIENVIQG